MTKRRQIANRSPGPYLQLIRPGNLVIIAGIQMLVWHFLVKPGVAVVGSAPALSDLENALLTLATLCLAAGANVINDIYDAETDRINKPHRTWIPEQVTIRQAVVVYTGISLLGAIVSVYTGISSGFPHLIPLYPIAVLGLWAYSAFLKSTPLAGNIAVSLFCAGVILIVAVPEWSAQFPDHYRSSTWIFALFAGLATFYRELVKDAEDVTGDGQSGHRSFPLVAGFRATKLLSAAVLVLLLLALIIWETEFLRHENTIRWVYLILAVGIPILTALILTWRAKGKEDYHRLSQLAKAFMLTGSLVVIFI